MPVKHKKTMQTVINSYILYVIVDFDLKEFYIGNTRSNRLSAEYWSHYNKKNKYTKGMIENIQAIGNEPKMFYLTTVECTKVEANMFMLPYIRFFQSYELSCLNRPQFVSLTDSLEGKGQELYLYLTQYTIEELCNPNTDLFPNYNQTKKQKKDLPTTITLRITEEQYLTIQKNATRQNKSVSKFCKEMALLDAHVVQIDYDNLKKYNKSLAEIRETLQQILYTIYKMQEYYPEDLNILQQIVDTAIKIENEASVDMKKELKKLRSIIP